MIIESRIFRDDIKLTSWQDLSFWQFSFQFVAIDAHSDLFCIFCAQNFAISSKASLDHHKQGFDL